MKAYESFLRDAGTPIGLIGALMLGGWILFRSFTFMFSSTPEEKRADAFQDDWTARCEQLSVGKAFQTDTEKFGDLHFCVTVTSVEYPSYDYSAWFRGCEDLGGYAKSISRNSYACYRQVVVEELGSRENWEGTP